MNSEQFTPEIKIHQSVQDNPILFIPITNIYNNINIPVSVYSHCDKPKLSEIKFLKHLARIITGRDKCVALCFDDNNNTLLISANSLSVHSRDDNNLQKLTYNFIEDLKKENLLEIRQSKTSKQLLNLYTPD